MLIRHPADRWNIVRALAAPVVLFGPLAVALPFVYHAPLLAVFVLAFGDMNYLLHLHVHRRFSDSAWFNRLLDACLGLTAGMTAANWRIHHLHGHHRGIDAPYRPRGGIGGGPYAPWQALSYSVRAAGLTFWRPLVESIEKGAWRDVRTPLHYRAALVEQALFIAAVAALCVWRPAFTLLFLLPWYVWVNVLTRYVDYLNHYDCDEHDRDPCARANNSLSPIFNRSCNNFGYHTAHHLRPSAHWTELPDIHRKIAHRIPSRCLKPFAWFTYFMPYHAVRSRLGRM